MPKAPHLKTLRDISGGEQGVMDFVHMVHAQRRGTLNAPVPALSVIEVQAVVNHGRWIVNCPFCGGAELADPEDHRFFCCSCGNEDALGQWLQVRWPAEKQAIETALLKRGKEHTRNWTPGETAEQLNKETR